MNLSQIKHAYYTRFSFLGKQYRFSLRTKNFKTANLVGDQIKRGLERGIFNSFEPGSEGERILRHLIARPGLRAEEAMAEINPLPSGSGFKRRLIVTLRIAKWSIQLGITPTRNGSSRILRLR